MNNFIIMGMIYLSLAVTATGTGLAKSEATTSTPQSVSPKGEYQSYMCPQERPCPIEQPLVVQGLERQSYILDAVGSNPAKRIEDQIRYYEPELADTLIRLAKCESSLNPNAVGDHGKSFGLYQIHLGYWPEVGIKNAQDVKWSTEWTAQKFREGKWYLWTCARKLNLRSLNY